MSKLNINEWKDRSGKIMDIGQRVVAVRGKTLVVGEILWFTKSGVTVAHERINGDKETISVVIYNTKRDKFDQFLIL